MNSVTAKNIIKTLLYLLLIGIGLAFLAPIIIVL